MEEKKTLVVATGNKNKLIEIARIFPEYSVISQKEAGFDYDVEETGTTFVENALLKAECACKALNLPVIADDSGLCVKALNGAPGIFSARFAGEHGNDKANRTLLLEKMENVADRSAYFESAVALVKPNGEKFTASGRTYGQILLREEGEGGFGYDCIFYSDDLKKSFGTAAPEEKDSVSHRYRALMELRKKTGGEI